MKKLFILLLFLCIPLVIAQVEIKNVVNDYANVLDEQSKVQITNIADVFKDQAQFAVVTIKSLEGKDINSYSYDLAQGHLGATGKDNGLLLLIAVDDHQYRFEVGRKLEIIFNDAKIGRIGRTYLVPNFKNNEYGKGIIEASTAIKNIMQGNETQMPEEISFSNAQWIIFAVIIITIILFKIMTAYANKEKYFRAGKKSTQIFGPVWGGGNSGGSSGGFGGGSFGGGGAGGSW